MTRRAGKDFSVVLHVTGEPTEAWYAEIAQLLADIVGPWQTLRPDGNLNDPDVAVADIGSASEEM
jgi:hypothetical protein